MVFNIRKPSLNQNQQWPQYLTVLTSLLIIFSSGIHSGWPSSAIPILLSKNSPLNVTSEAVSYITTVSIVGEIIGTILFPILMDLIGRKYTLMLATPLFITSALLIYFCSVSVILLYMARIIGGLASRGCLTIIPVYIGEISEAKIRGSLESTSAIFLEGGAIFINLLGTYTSIESAGLITLTFPVMFLASFIFMPESPYFFLMKKKNEKARNSLTELRWNENVAAEILKLEKDVRRQMSQSGRFRDLFLIKSNRRVLSLMCSIAFIECFSGAVVFTVYGQIFFARTTKIISPEWAVMIIQIVKLVFMMVGSAIIDIAGRRLLLLVSTFGCFLTLSYLTSYFILRDYTALQVEKFDWSCLVAAIFFAIFFSVGLLIGFVCLQGELFSANVKGKASCVIQITACVCLFPTIKLFQFFLDNYSTGYAFMTFGIIQFLGFWYCWFYVLETKGKTLEEIQEELR